MTTVPRSQLQLHIPTTDSITCCASGCVSASACCMMFLRVLLTHFLSVPALACYLSKSSSGWILSSPYLHLYIVEVFSVAGPNPPGCWWSSSRDKDNEYHWIRGDSRMAPQEVYFPDVHRVYSVVPVLFSNIHTCSLLPTKVLAHAMWGKQKSSEDQVSTCIDKDSIPTSAWFPPAPLSFGNSMRTLLPPNTNPMAS